MDHGTMLEIRRDTLESEQTRALLALHLQGMLGHSPREYVFALDLSALKVPEITVWSAWEGDRIAGIGALKALDDRAGEIKSMRTHPDFLRRGVAARLLDRIIAEARQRGMQQLSLETGSGPAFEPALALYRRRSFVEGEAFGAYVPNPFSQYLHLSLTGGELH